MPLALGDERHSHQPSTAPARDADFVALYESHFDGVYDFVVRIVRDHDLAADVVQDSFTTAWQELHAGREVKHFKAWIYAIARNRAIDELRRRRRVQPAPATSAAAGELAFAVADPSRQADPEAVVADKEIAQLVWSSAAALSPEEYSLLDMHLRQGLRSSEIADALELSRGAVHTRLSRLRNSLEDSVVSTLLVRRGRSDCTELAAVVAAGEGEKLTPELRRKVREHVKTCEVCQGNRRKIAAPAAIFGALAPIPALPGVRESILAGMVVAKPAAGGVAAGSHTAASHSAAASGKVAGVAAAVVAAGVAGLLLLGSGVGGPHDPARAASTSHSVGVASTDPVIRMRWAPGKNADGYSVLFSRDRSVEPPARVNVRGTTFKSRPLAPGRWWFILRTHGRDGKWTDTLRRGPYVIEALVARRVTHAAGSHHGHARHGQTTTTITSVAAGGFSSLTAFAVPVPRVVAQVHHHSHHRHTAHVHQPPLSDGGPGVSLNVPLPPPPPPPLPPPPPAPSQTVQNAPTDTTPPVSAGQGGGTTGTGTGDQGPTGGNNGGGDEGDNGDNGHPPR